MREGIILDIKNDIAVIMLNEGEFVSVPAKQIWNVGDFISVSEIEMKRNNNISKNEHKRRTKSVFGILVASLLIFLLPLSFTSQAKTYITIDINPSIELEIINNEVKKINPLNEDAEKLLSELIVSKKNKDIYYVTDAIITQAYSMGYIKKEADENFIMIGVSTNTDDFALEEYENSINETLTEKEINADLLILSATEEEKELADEKGISIGRYMLQNLKEEDKSENINNSNTNNKPNNETNDKDNISNKQKNIDDSKKNNYENKNTNNETKKTDQPINNGKITNIQNEKNNSNNGNINENKVEENKNNIDKNTNIIEKNNEKPNETSNKNVKQESNNKNSDNKKINN